MCRILEPAADPLSVCDFEVMSYSQYQTLINLAADNGDSTVPCEPESCRKHLGWASISTGVVPRRPAEDSDSDHPIDDEVRYEEEEPDIDNEVTRKWSAFEILGYNFFEAERLARGVPEPPLPRRTNLNEMARRNKKR